MGIPITGARASAAAWRSPTVRLWVLIPLFGIILVAGLWWAVLSRLTAEEQSILASALRDNERHVAAFEEHTLRAMRDIDRTALLAKYEFERDGQVNVHALVTAGLLPYEGAMSMSILDAKGRVIDSSDSVLSLPGTSDRPQFQTHRGGDSGELYISGPVAGDSTQPVIEMTRRLNARDGSFAGVVVISVAPVYFTDFYEDPKFGRTGMLSVLGHDGVYRARRVGDRTESGMDGTTTTLYGNSLRSPAGAYAGVSGVDGIDRLVAYRRMAEYPLILATAQAKDEVLGPYYERRHSALLVSLLASLAITGCIAGGMLLLARVERNQRRAEQAEALFRAAAEGGLDAFVLLRTLRDPLGEVVDFEIHEANPRAATLLGAPRERLLGWRIQRLLDNLAVGHLFPLYVHVAETGEPLDHEVEVHTRRGEVFWMHQQVVRVRDGIAVTACDITSQKYNEEQLRTKSSFLQALIDNLPLGIIVRSARPESFGKTEVWNPVCHKMYGMDQERTLGHTYAEFLPGEPADRGEMWDRRMLVDPKVQRMTNARTDIPGVGLRYLNLVRAPILDAAGQVEHIITIASDVTAEKTRADELRLASKVFETTADAVLLSDAEDRVIMVNAALVDMMGFSSDELRSRPVGELPFGAGRLESDTTFLLRLLREARVSQELLLRRKDGTELPVWTTTTCVLDEHGDIANVVRVFSDISALKQSQQQLEKLANYDTLTGLPNRRLFQDRLELALHRARRTSGGAALLFIDLDGFKEVNDNIGHDVGDLLLTEVARRLSRSVRAADSVCRLGGDEFTVIVEDANLPDDALAVCDRVLQELTAPFLIAGHRIQTSASIGAAFFPDHGSDSTTLLRNADVAMYQAKKAGRNRYALSSAAGRRDARELAATIDDAARPLACPDYNQRGDVLRYSLDTMLVVSNDRADPALGSAPSTAATASATGLRTT